MRLFVTHQTTCRYAQPPNGVVHLVRLTPRDYEGQYVVHWRIDVSQDARLDQREDAFGNIVHAFSLQGPIEEVTVLVEGEIETQDTLGVVRNAVERFPPALYLRETTLTTADAALSTFATEIAAQGSTPLERMHQLMMALHERASPSEPQEAPASPAAATAVLAGTAGDCQALTHAFIASAHAMGVPARYVSGHVHNPDRGTHPMMHGWAEAYIPGLGWVGFDAVNALCPTELHVRVAVGLDALGASPVRSTQYGGGGEQVSVMVRTSQTYSQSQSESQSQSQSQSEA